MIDHDRLFKELLSTFFVEFIELFFPEMLDYIDTKSISFLDKEIFTDVTEGAKYEADLLVQVQFKGKPSFFLIHGENQASASASFGKRMFRYFARLFEKHDCAVYPIVVFSYDQPQSPATNEFRVDFPDFSVLRFSYRVVQLNQLNWRDFLTKQNPVASALMAKMNVALADRPKVKAECLRLLVTLKLDPARTQLISGFVDTYLSLTPEEESAFRLEVNQIEPEQQEEIMEIVTSWMKQGISIGRQEGRQEGRQQGEAKMLLRLLTNQMGPLDSTILTQVEGLNEQQLEQLGDRLPKIKATKDLTDWLSKLQTSPASE